MAEAAVCGARALEQIEQEDQQQRDDDPKRQISQIVQGPSSSHAGSGASAEQLSRPLLDRTVLAYCQPSKR